MAVEIKGLKGLTSFSSLTPAEKAAWRRQNRDLFEGTRLTTSDEEKIYNTQRFIKSYGRDKAKGLSYEQRIAYEQDEVKAHNDYIIAKTAHETFSPFREDGSVDPNKGVGDMATFYKIMNMDPLFQKELLESDWKTNREIELEILEKDAVRTELLNQPQNAARMSMYAALYGLIGRDASAKIDRGKNDNIFNSIYAKDLAAKEKKAMGQTDYEYNQINIPDTHVNEEFIKAINPSDKNKIGVPQLAAFFDENGNPLSSEVDNLDIDMKRRWIAKVKAYSKLYDPGTAYDMLDKEAKDYLHERQSGFIGGLMEYTPALLKDIAIGASAYTADKVNALRAAWLSFDKGQVKTYQDMNGRFYGKEHLLRDELGNLILNDDGKAIYRDPDTEEEIPVEEIYASKSALDAQGIAPDGTTRSAFFNNRYWSDAEATGMWSRKEQARAKALNGYSPSKAVYKLGDDKDYLWEVAKMTQFALADVALSAIPSAGVLAGTKMMGSAVANGSALFAREVKDIGAALYYTSKAAQVLSPTLGAAGIGHAYGRGVFGETLEGNMLKVDTALRQGAEDRYHSLFEPDKEGISEEEKETRASKREEIKAKIGEEVSQQLAKIGANKLSQLSKEEYNELVSNLFKQAQQKVARDAINEDVEQMKASSEYQEMVTEAAESATSAALTAAWTTGIKYAFVNNFGYRNFLFKDPLKRANSAASKALGRAVEDKGGKVVWSQKFANMNKKQKAWEITKVAGSQMYGGAWTNFTDEAQSWGAKQMNEDRMGAYLNGDYNVKGKTTTLGAIGSVLSYLKGASYSLSEGSTWNAGLVGALGSATSVAPNVMSLASGRFRSEWNKAQSWQERANLLISNGILNTYYDKVIGERQAKETVDKWNTLVDEYEGFRELGEGIALDMASADATNDHDADALSYMKAARLALALKNFSKDESRRELFGLAKKTSVFNDALETVDKILNDNFSEEDARNYLTEYYAKNPSVAQSEENNAAALTAIKTNAERLKSGIEAMQQVEDNMQKVEKKTGVRVSNLVKGKLLERFALDHFLTDRIAEVEEGISGSSGITAESIKEAYGNEKALNARIAEISNLQEGLSKEIEKAKANRDKAVEKAKKYLEDRDGDLSNDEWKEYAKLQNLAESAEMQVKSLEEQKRGLLSEGDKLAYMSQDKSEKRVISSEEILRLSPEDRARMLDERNLKNYSKEQQEEITKARATLALRDPSLLDDVQYQALMVQRRRANAKAYEMMLSNPEAAAAQLEADAETEEQKYPRVFRERSAEAMNNFIKNLEEAPSSTKDALEKLLEHQLLNFGMNQVDFLKELKGLGKPYIEKYSHVFDKAITTLEIMNDAKNSILKLENINDHQRKLVTEAVGNVIMQSSGKQDFLNRLNTAIANSKELSDSDKALMQSVLTNLEQVYNLQSSTITITEEEKSKAQEEATKKREEEQKRVSEAEEAARAEAENKAAEEASKPNISDKDNDNTNEKIAEREAAGISEEDTKSSEQDLDAMLEAHGLTREDLSTDNESSITPEMLEQIKAQKEGLVELVESPTIEEQEKKNPDTVDIIEAPRVVPEETTSEKAQEDRLQGNPLFEYDETLIKSGIEKRRTPRDPNKALAKLFAWEDKYGVKLQKIIDEELGKIFQLDPDVHIMYTNPLGTEDKGMESTGFLVVEYTSKIDKIHNNDNGGVFEVNGKKYLVIGTLGFNGSKQWDLLKPVINHGKEERYEYFKSNQSDRFFIDTKYYTKLRSVGNGRLVRQTANDSEVRVRSISELLDDQERNPRGLKLENLKWYIQQGEKIATVNVSSRIRISPDRAPEANSGSVFLLVESASGEYIPAKIRPVRYQEISEGKLKKLIQDLFNDLASTDHSVRKAAVDRLRELIVLKEKELDINIGTADKPKVSVIVDGKVKRTFQLKDQSFNPTDLLNELELANFRINITTSTLLSKDMLKMYDEAGALTTDIAKLSTSNADFSVFPMDGNGNPIISEVKKPTSSRTESDLERAQRHNDSEQLFNVTYRKGNDGRWYVEGDPSKPVTDPSLQEQLTYRNLIRTQELKPSKVTGQDEIFILNSDLDNPLAVIRGARGNIRVMTKEGAIKIINEVNAEAAERAKQEKLKEEIEREVSEEKTLQEMSEEEKLKAASSGEEVDLGLDGEENTDNTNDNNTSEDIEFELDPKSKEILDRSETLEVSKDDNTVYVDKLDGSQSVRATTLIGAEKTGSVFGLPKGFHTETVGGESLVTRKLGHSAEYYWIQGNRLMSASIPASAVANVTLEQIKEQGEATSFESNRELQEVKDFLDGKESAWILPSTTLGTGIHNFVEDVLFGREGNAENYAKRYPNMTNANLQRLAREAKKLKTRILQDYHLVGTEVTIKGDVEIVDPSDPTKKRVVSMAGTIDLLLKNKKTGQYVIYDFKTKRGNITNDDIHKWSLQLSLYKQVLERQYGVAVEAIEIVPISLTDDTTPDKKYPAPRGKGGTTEYTEENGQLYANGEKYTNAEASIGRNIPLTVARLSFQYNRLSPEVQKLTRVVEDTGSTKPSTKVKEAKDNSQPVVPTSSPKTTEDINSTGSKSLSELQSKKKTDTALSLLKSREFRGQVLEALREKFKDLPSDKSEIVSYLERHKIRTTGITDVNSWIAEIKECKV